MAQRADWSSEDPGLILGTHVAAHNCNSPVSGSTDCFWHLHSRHKSCTYTQESILIYKIKSYKKEKRKKLLFATDGHRYRKAQPIRMQNCGTQPRPTHPSKWFQSSGNISEEGDRNILKSQKIRECAVRVSPMDVRSYTQSLTSVAT